MKAINVKYGGFEAEQQVDESLYDAIYNKAIDDFSKELKEQYDVYSGSCVCRKAVSLDKVFEIAKRMKGEIE